MNMMKMMMFRTYTSKLGFDETVERLHAQALENGWTIPYTYDLQEAYIAAGHEDMTKVTILYFCNSGGGYEILKDDSNKMMSVLMPTGVTVYEDSRGAVKIAAMNFGLMHNFFLGTNKRVFKDAAARMARSLDSIVE
ncbi:MAG: DUF302 domain-containing protein [Chloroflexi bacterium]|nr:DUF302 domain-containing protein [Chloroflexota bacterium]